MFVSGFRCTGRPLKALHNLNYKKMGEIKKGVHGGFSGKVGNVVGSSWKGIDYMKGLSKISHKPGSLKQITQRLRFAVVNRFLGPMSEILVKGWKGQATGRTTPVNLAVQHTLANSLVGTYPDFTIDPSLVLISKGNLGKLTSLVVQSTDPASLSITWQFITGDDARNMDDAVTAVVYNPAQEMFVTYSGQVVRQDMTYPIALPDDFTGQDVHVYVFCTKRDDVKRSSSQYNGPITIA